MAAAAGGARHHQRADAPNPTPIPTPTPTPNPTPTPTPNQVRDITDEQMLVAIHTPSAVSAAVQQVLRDTLTLTLTLTLTPTLTRTLTLTLTLPLHRHRSPLTAHLSPFTLTLPLTRCWATGTSRCSTLPRTGSATCCRTRCAR